ncbi:MULTISPECIES: flagellar export chaperone FliS [Thermodesulfobacterium]|jgi:flagellar protein FliS|nr:MULTISPECIES: flagellar export chaperone FliS [Thermodesulfobacterium]KUJ97369.1 MAG: Flagellar protein FliS [Thermodesulfobacterium sp. 37_54]KUK19069.1 MAG: Flagellar protein FliS [Thermodesulfobacterium commune]KUK38251.1 MAG: Flagellar protein FliS [Thermodesulfobacterium commune]MBZ4681377.1 flagellar biosynthesis protein FliS [Thermodesulfobacterium sp.]MDK2861239.1 flagellar secretion chaperone FliS [Thermodesulfobacterium sp.]
MVKMVYNYLENQVKNADPLDLVIMLYSKAISCLKISKNVIESGLNNPEDIKKKAENLGKATDIIAYLQGSLNLEKGGDIAKNLNEIYQTLLDELIVANTQNDAKKITDSIEVLEKLKKAWEEIKCQSQNSKKD